MSISQKQLRFLDRPGVLLLLCSTFIMHGQNVQLKARVSHLRNDLNNRRMDYGVEQVAFKYANTRGKC